MADILHRVRIAAPPKSVFRAISTPEGIAHWWTDDSTSESRTGSVSVFRFMGGRVVFRMRVEAFEPERRLAWTCLGDYDEWNDTTLSWELEPAEDGGTVLKLAHRGWRSIEKEFPQCNTSWGHLLYLLKDHLEGKSAQPPESGRGDSATAS
ncbi:MAG: SRPBCC domain-containing protein [Acidobacteriota bacterium]